MATPRYVGLIGKARSGKDFVGRLLDHERMAFADPVKEFLYSLNPRITATLTLRETVDEMGWDEAKKIPEVRRLLQDSAEAHRALDPDLWVSIARRRMPTDRPVVFTDVRYPNEAAFIRELGGVLIRVRRPGEGLDDPLAKAPSETLLEGIEADLDLLNDAYVAIRLHQQLDQYERTA